MINPTVLLGGGCNTINTAVNHFQLALSGHAIEKQLSNHAMRFVAIDSIIAKGLSWAIHGIARLTFKFN